MVRSGSKFICAVTILLCTVPARPEPLRFDQVPYVYAQDRARFQQLWQDAMIGTTRIAMFGDSQETSPSGQGIVYVPRFSYELWRYYGNVPETQIASYGSFGATIPPAEWLLQGRTGAPGPSPSRLAPNQLPPGLNARAHSTRNPTGNINGQKYGQLASLMHDAARTSELAEIPLDTAYLDPTATIRAQVFAATNPSSGDVMFRARPHDTTSPSFFSTVTTSGTLGLGLESERFEIKSALTPPLDYGGKTYLALELTGDNDDKLTDIIGMRFLNTDDPSGVVVQDLSAGGYRVHSFLDNHGDAGAMFASAEFDVALFHYGANDAGGSSAADFKANTQALIARLRDWKADPQFPVILMGDPHREGLTETKQGEFDHYAGVQLEIAQADPNVMVVNSRRLSEDLGWGASGDLTLYLSDGVHYTGLGARELARVEVAAMLGAVPGDLNLDGMVDVADLAVFSLNFATNPGPGSWRLGDFNGDDAVNVADLALLALNFGTSIVDATAATPLSLHAAAVLAGVEVAALPEPATSAILFLLGWAGLSRRATLTFRSAHPPLTQVQPRRRQ